MQNNNYSKILMEALLIAAVTTILAISALQVSILSMILILIPVPFMILSYRHGHKYSIFSFIIFILLMGVATNFNNSVYLGIIFAPMTIAMSYCLKKEKEPYLVIGAGTVVTILSITMVFKVIASVGGIDIVKEISVMAEHIVNTQVDMLKSLEADIPSTESIISYLLLLIPGILMIQSLLIAMGNYYLAVNLLARIKSTDFNRPQFSTFRLPQSFTMGSFMIMALSYLTKYIEGIYHTSLITTVVILFMALFFIQGISVISFLIKRTNINHVVRVLLIGIILLISPLLTAVSFIGLIDSIVDIRKLERRE